MKRFVVAVVLDELEYFADYLDPAAVGYDIFEPTLTIFNKKNIYLLHFTKIGYKSLVPKIYFKSCMMQPILLPRK